MLWQDCVVEAAIAYHSTTQPPRSGSDIRIMPALEPARLLMLVEEPLPGSPPTPEPAAIRVTCLVLHPQHQSARPWFVYRGMIARQSGQGDEPSPAQYTTPSPVAPRCRPIQQETCASGSLVRLKRLFMFQRTKEPGSEGRAYPLILRVWDRDGRRWESVVTFAPSRRHCHLRLAGGVVAAGLHYANNANLLLGRERNHQIGFVGNVAVHVQGLP